MKNSILIYFLELVYIFVLILKGKCFENNLLNETAIQENLKLKNVQEKSTSFLSEWKDPHKYLRNIFEDNSKRSQEMMERNEEISEAEELLPVILKSIQFPTKMSNLTDANPLLMNLVINFNFNGNYEKKSFKKPKKKGTGTVTTLMKRAKRELGNRQSVFIEKNSKQLKLEDFWNIIERIKLKIDLTKKKRSVDIQSSNFMKKLSNIYTTSTQNHNNSYLFDEKVPKITFLNDDGIDASKWLKNWKDILAVNPILRTEKPTKPETEFIDEWKYLYRVTMYNSGSYNISNFVCSGIQVAPQWVLTSSFCDLGDNLIILIGVHTLPKTILNHNHYTVQRKIYSPSQNLELIQMDRPVPWKFTPPNIRTVKMDEMNVLLQEGKCRVLSWIPVKIGQKIFELREYPRLQSGTWTLDGEVQDTEKSLRVAPFENYELCEGDLGSPILCDGILTGILLNVEKDCRNNLTMELLCPVLDWVTFFTKESTYFEVTARRITVTNSSNRSISGIFSIILFAPLIYYSII